MARLTIEIEGKKNLRFFLELLGKLDFVKIISGTEESDSEPSKEEVIQGLEVAFQELKLVQEGKMTAFEFEDVLNEL